MSMQNTDLLAATCRVALAAYLHDLGKFAERARIDVPKDALAAHKTQYCPFHTTDKGVQIRFTGRYEDELRRVNGAWEFARRKLHQDMPPPAKP